LLLCTRNRAANAIREDIVLEYQEIDRSMKDHYEAKWRRGDPWEFESSEYERAKYDRQLQLIGDRRYARALEIGCGSGVFTHRLAGICDRILALDIAEAAVDRARRNTVDVRPGVIEFRAMNVMKFKPETDGPWDLINFSETIYCLGLYPFFDIAWVAHRLVEFLRPDGRLLMANTFDEQGDWLLRPWLVRTYHDLFANLGLRVGKEEIWTGLKNGVRFEVLINLFEKSGQ
jgi:SAM-dependent methyltransferase